MPERKQRVQAYTLLGEPFTIAFTLLTLGFHVLLERLCECETLMPNATSLPQNSHFAIMGHLPYLINRQYINRNFLKKQAFF